MISAADLEPHLAELAILTREDGWHEGEGSAVPEAVFDGARELLRLLLAETALPLPEIYPATEGRLQLSFTVAGEDLEIDVHRDGETVDVVLVSEQPMARAQGMQIGSVPRWLLAVRPALAR